MRVFLIILVCVTVAACSKPTAPTPPPASAASQTRVISLIGNLVYGAVPVGSSVTFTLTIINSGTGPLTVSSVALPGGYTASWNAGTIAAGSSQAVTIRFSPTAVQSYNGTVVVNGDQTSGTNTIAVSGTGVAPPRIVVSGTIRDGTSGGVLPGITVFVDEGKDIGTSVKSNAAGVYSLSVSFGTFRMSFVATGYAIESREVAVASDAQIDVVLQRLPPSPPPAPGRPPPSPIPPNAFTFLSIVSDPGESIGQGQSRTYRLGNGNWGWGFLADPFTGTQRIVVDYNNSTAFLPSSDWWYLDMAAPAGRTLGVGTYPNASRYADVPSSQPGLSFFGSGRDCATVTGSFTISAIAIGAGDRLDYLAATFEQHCNGDSKALRGEVVIVGGSLR